MEKFTTQMRKGILEYLILGIIQEGDIYGAEIIEKLKGGNIIVAEGTIYPLLSRLKTENLINYYWIESESGHPRKYFHLTEEGSNMLIIMERSWIDIRDSVEKVLHK